MKNKLLAFILIVLAVMAWWSWSGSKATTVTYKLLRPWTHQNRASIESLNINVIDKGLGLLSSGARVNFEISGTIPAAIDCVETKVTKVYVQANWVPETTSDPEFSTKLMSDKQVVADYVMTPILEQDRSVLAALLNIGENCDANTKTKPYTVSFEENVLTWSFGSNAYRVRTGNINQEFLIHQGK